MGSNAARGGASLHVHVGRTTVPATGQRAEPHMGFAASRAAGATAGSSAAGATAIPGFLPVISREHRTHGQQYGSAATVVGEVAGRRRQARWPQPADRAAH